jgi:CheY-like chemotaxis protein
MNTILIVDDHPDIRHLMRLLLTHNYTLLESDNGHDALEKTRKHRPDVLVLDVMMPGDMDGLQVLKAIKSDPELKQTYVIMVTARGQAKDMEFATSLGANAYFIKPFSPLALANHIREQLNKSTTEQLNK